ncbi:hypothetical protein MTO96_002772 [Rhipicephalus appendiculatus]
MHADGRLPRRHVYGNTLQRQQPRRAADPRARLIVWAADVFIAPSRYAAEMTAGSCVYRCGCPAEKTGHAAVNLFRGNDA